MGGGIGRVRVDGACTGSCRSWRMSPRKSLSSSMTLDEFDHGYWYATELKAFARTLGVRAGSLRKDQLERAVRSFLASGRVAAIANPPGRRENAVVRESDAGLTMKRRI